MSKGCPYCDSKKADSNLDYRCPECEHVFWKSRKVFENHLKALPTDVRNRSKKKELEPKDSASKEHQFPILFRGQFFVVSFEFGPYILKVIVALIILSIIAGIGEDFLSNHSTAQKFSDCIWIVTVIYVAVLTAGYAHGYIFHNDKRKLHEETVNEQGETEAPIKKPDAKVGKMHCNDCGKKIDADSNFCIYCGSEVARKKSK